MRSIWKDADVPEDLVLWRYMRPERFVEVMRQGTLYFASTEQFEDPFEGAVAVVPNDVPLDPRYPEPDPIDKAFARLRRLTKASCWHIAEFESDAMWKLYAGERKGVALRTTAGRIRSALQPFRLAPTYEEEVPYWGIVRYQDLHQVRLKVGSEERFFYKHRAFEWEQEFRVLFTLRMAEESGVAVPDAGISVPFSPHTLVESVYLGPCLSSEDRASVTAACSGMPFASRLQTSSLLGRPRYY